MSLTKTKLISGVHAQTRCSRKNATDLVELLLETIKETLLQGEDLKISGFGNFYVRSRAARSVPSLRSGAPTRIPEGRSLVFQPSRVLKAAVQTKYRAKKNSRVLSG